jgi:hypothetical protein
MLIRRSYLQWSSVLGALAVAVSACSSSKSPTPGQPDAATDTDANAAGDGGDSGPLTLLRPWDFTGVVGTGQSLSVGDEGLPFTATSQPFHNLKLSLGSLTGWPLDDTSSALSLVPLLEPLRPTDPNYPSAYPGNLDGETPHTALADEVTALAMAADGRDYVTVQTAVGESGQAMNVIDKTAMEFVDAGTSTGRAYAATLFEAKAINRLAVAQNKTYGIGAIVITHGEADAGNAGYEQALVQLWSDYNVDLAAITGQMQKIPMFVSQQHSVPNGMGTTSTSTQAQWKVGIDHPGDIICSGPKYQYPFATDFIHLTAVGYDRLGEKYGEVYFEKVVLGHDWQPLQPISAVRAGSVITIHYHVPVSPMTWDDALPAPHQAAFPEWAMGRGFEVTSSGSRITITSVDIAGDDIHINCASDLTGGFVVLSYAQTTDGVGMPGGTMRWGQLRDSDPFVGSTTHSAQPNYAVAFTMTVQ